MKLSPVVAAPDPGYPPLAGRVARGLFLAAVVTATSLGGCGPAIDSRAVNHVVDRGDLDASVACPPGDTCPEIPAPTPPPPAPR